MALNEGPIAGRRGIGGVSVDMILVLMALGLALTFAAVLYVAANVGGLVAHRAWPGLGFNDAVTGLGPVHHPGNPALSYPAGIRARLPGPVIYWTVAVLMVVVPIVAAQLVWRRVAVGQQAKRRGLASRRRIRLAMGASGITARAKSLRPTLAQTRKPTVEDVAAPMGRSIPFNVECWVTCEESMVVAAPKRCREPPKPTLSTSSTTSCGPVTPPASLARAEVPTPGGHEAERPPVSRRETPTPADYLAAGESDPSNGPCKSASATSGVDAG